MPTLYGLHIGINHYQGLQNQLNLCVADVHNFQTKLASSMRPGWTYAPYSLVDAQATKSAIINAFNTHFSRAQGDDVCLLHFVGHGSQLQLPPPEVATPNDPGCFETIVAYDSRGGAGDIIDKELAHLIGKLNPGQRFSNQGHVAVILDCCHSGDGTRDPDQPTEVMTRNVAPLYDMPFNYFYDYQFSGAYPRRGDHLMLSACGADELALDGVMMANLRSILDQYGGQLTYRQLTGLLAQHTGNVQTPHLHAYPGQYADFMFLGGAIR